jgi:hypothetical protein
MLPTDTAALKIVSESLLGSLHHDYGRAAKFPRMRQVSNTSRSQLSILAEMVADGIFTYYGLEIDSLSACFESLDDPTRPSI